jgi:hypothetical protein
MLSFLRSRNEQVAARIAELRQIELDAAEACRLAVELLPPDEPLTRGQLLSFLAEHEQHAYRLATLLTKLPRVKHAPTSTLVKDFNGRGSTGILRVIRKNAEIGVRTYQHALTLVPEPLVPLIRTQTNAWLRHRAWLTARIDAFARTRDSHPNY